MVAQALNTNPQVRCFREIFHFMHDYVDYYVEGYDPKNREDFDLRARDPVRFLQERIFGRAASRDPRGGLQVSLPAFLGLRRPHPAPHG